MDASVLGHAMLMVAQDTAPDFGFWEVSTDEWTDGSGNVSVFLGDNEIEVVVTRDTAESAYADLIWDAVEGRSSAAASVAMERSAERSQMGVTW